jgi:hypothetical protein
LSSFIPDKLETVKGKTFRTAGPATVRTTLRHIAADPVEYLIRRWNWKAAVTSAVIRGSIFFTANLSAGLDAAFGVLLTEFVFRTVTSGSYGSVIQAFRHAEPAWAAALTTTIVLPVCNHTLEFLVHWARGTPMLGRSIAASVVFTVIATLFNLHIMRKGALVVGDGAKPLWQDLKDMPSLLVSFIAVGPMAAVRASRALLRMRRGS